MLSNLLDAVFLQLRGLAFLGLYLKRNKSPFHASDNIWNACRSIQPAVSLKAKAVSFFDET